MTVLVCLLALADNCDHEGRCVRSLAGLAEQARVARSTYKLALRNAESLGEVVREHQGGTRPGDTNTYRLALVDNLLTMGSAPDPIPESDGVDMGSIRGRPVGHKAIEAIDTQARVRARVREGEPPPIPPAVEPSELRERVGEIRDRLRPPALAVVEEPPEYEPGEEPW
jgi:hypothetical protein